MTKTKADKQVEYLDLDLDTGKSTPPRKVCDFENVVMGFKGPLKASGSHMGDLIGGGGTCGN